MKVDYIKLTEKPFTILQDNVKGRTVFIFSAYKGTTNNKNYIGVWKIKYKSVN